jgi:hypothetical protein
MAMNQRKLEKEYYRYRIKMREIDSSNIGAWEKWKLQKPLMNHMKMIYGLISRIKPIYNRIWGIK